MFLFLKFKQLQSKFIVLYKFSVNGKHYLFYSVKKNGTKYIESSAT